MFDLRRLACIMALVPAMAVGTAVAQTAVPPPAPVQSQPLPPLPGPGPAPSLPPAASPAPAPQQAAPAAPPSGAAQRTLAPPPADPSNWDEVTLTPRPATALRAQSTWDDGYETLVKTFDTLKNETEKAGLRANGAPLATFLQTDDLGFTFEAMLPVEALPASRPADLPPAVTFAQTPSGPAIRFTHEGPYDDIDSTYEAITASLDSRGIDVKDSFTEEYVRLGTDAGDASLQIYIYVQPKGR